MQYDMVFEGGGAKGMVFVGALKALQDRGITPSRLLGTSAGSIMATFMAAGYDAQEMSQALTEKLDDKPVFLGFLETPPPFPKEAVKKSAIRQFLREVNFSFITDGLEEKLDDGIANALASSPQTNRVFSFIEYGGVFTTNNFLTWLRTKLNSGIYNLDRGEHLKGTPRSFGDMNLARYYRATGIDLSLVAADTSSSKLLILNHNTAPDCPVIWAVRMSMSVPLLWEEVIWQPAWGKYRGKDIMGHTIVDGGLISNFPIELFISNQPHITSLMGAKASAATKLLGFLIDEAIEVPDAPEIEADQKKFEIGGLRTVERLQKLFNTLTQAHDKTVIEAYERFVIRLPARGYGMIEFGMSDERREALVSAGSQATRDYFSRQETAIPASGLFEPEPLDHAFLEPADKIASNILAP